MAPKMNIPEPFSSIIDNACADDREWFDTHPFAEQRVRPIVPGELWPSRYPDDARVLVTLLGSGMRARTCLTPHIEPYDADKVAVIEEHMRPMPQEWAERIV